MGLVWGGAMGGWGLVWEPGGHVAGAVGGIYGAGRVSAMGQGISMGWELFMGWAGGCYRARDSYGAGADVPWGRLDASRRGAAGGPGRTGPLRRGEPGLRWGLGRLPPPPLADRHQVPCPTPPHGDPHAAPRGPPLPHTAPWGPPHRPTGTPLPHPTGTPTLPHGDPHCPRPPHGDPHAAPLSSTPPHRDPHSAPHCPMGSPPLLHRVPISLGGVCVSLCPTGWGMESPPYPGGGVPVPQRVFPQPGGPPTSPCAPPPGVLPASGRHSCPPTSHPPSAAMGSPPTSPTSPQGKC